MSDEGILQLRRRKRLSTFPRDDRGEIKAALTGLSDLMGIGEAILIQEEYGLSVIFHEEGSEGHPEWEVVDPASRYSTRGTTPAGAIFWWDMQREETEEEKNGL